MSSSRLRPIMLGLVVALLVAGGAGAYWVHDRNAYRTDLADAEAAMERRPRRDGPPTLRGSRRASSSRQ